MPSSPWSPSGVLTIVSLVALCLLSFIVVFGSNNTVNTQVRDTVYSFPKRDTPHHRRAFHHARVPVPQASDPPASNDPQPDTPAATPTPVEPSSPPKQTPSSPNTQTPKQPPPAPSPSPSPKPQSQPPAQSPSTPPAPSSATPSSSATPAAAPSTSSPTTGPATTSNAPASSSLDVSSSQIKTVSNIPDYSATAYSYSYQPGSMTGLGGTSTGPNFLPNTAGSTRTVSADPTAGATAKGFFANKAGVGVTFGIVGIVGALALILGIRMLLKRKRNSREAREVDEWFEKYSTGHGSSSWHGDGQYASGRDDDVQPAGTGHNDGQYASGSRDDVQYSGSSNHDDSQYSGTRYGASSTDVAATAAMTAAAPGAYPDRSVHYGRQNAGSGGVVLPPSINFANAGGAAGAAASHSRRPSHSSGLRYSVTASQAQAGHPYAASANPAYAAVAPPMPPAPHVPYPPTAHGQDQASFAANGDPFYRPNATGAGGVRTGYAQ